MCEERAAREVGSLDWCRRHGDVDDQRLVNVARTKRRGAKSETDGRSGGEAIKRRGRYLELEVGVVQAAYVLVPAVEGVLQRLGRDDRLKQRFGRAGWYELQRDRIAHVMAEVIRPRIALEPQKERLVRWRAQPLVRHERGTRPAGRDGARIGIHDDVGRGCKRVAGAHQAASQSDRDRLWLRDGVAGEATNAQPHERARELRDHAAWPRRLACSQQGDDDRVPSCGLVLEGEQARKQRALVNAAHPLGLSTEGEGEDVICRTCDQDALGDCQRAKRRRAARTRLLTLAVTTRDGHRATLGSHNEARRVDGAKQRIRLHRGCGQLQHDRLWVRDDVAHAARWHDHIDELM